MTKAVSLLNIDDGPYLPCGTSFLILLLFVFFADVQWQLVCLLQRETLWMCRGEAEVHLVLHRQEQGLQSSIRWQVVELDRSANQAAAWDSLCSTSWFLQLLWPLPAIKRGFSFAEITTEDLLQPNIPRLVGVVEDQLVLHYSHLSRYHSLLCSHCSVWLKKDAAHSWSQTQDCASLQKTPWKSWVEKLLTLTISTTTVDLHSCYFRKAFHSKIHSTFHDYDQLFPIRFQVCWEEVHHPMSFSF